MKKTKRKTLQGNIWNSETNSGEHLNPAYLGCISNSSLIVISTVYWRPNEVVRWFHDVNVLNLLGLLVRYPGTPAGSALWFRKAHRPRTLNCQYSETGIFLKAETFLWPRSQTWCISQNANLLNYSKDYNYQVNQHKVLPLVLNPGISVQGLPRDPNLEIENSFPQYFHQN